MFRFSTRCRSDVHPVDAIREVFGPVDVVALGGQAIDLAVTARMVSGVQVSAQTCGPIEIAWRKSGVADVDDDLRLTLSVNGGGLFRCGADEEWIADGDVLIHGAATGSGAAPAPVTWQSLRIPRAVIAPLIAKDVGRRMRKASGNIGAVCLLRQYLHGLLDLDLDGQPEVAALAANHVRDLVAIVAGASRDGLDEAARGGVMAARRQIAKRYISENLLAPGLSDDSVAAALGLSASYVRKLFVAEGGLHAYVVERRLANAYDLLTNPFHAHRKVIDIAFLSGFSSLAAFNRQFKRRYGLTPSEARDITPS